MSEQREVGSIATSGALTYRDECSGCRALRWQLEEAQREREVESIIRVETYRELESERTARGPVECQLAEAQARIAALEGLLRRATPSGSDYEEQMLVLEIRSALDKFAGAKEENDAH